MQNFIEQPLTKYDSVYKAQFEENAKEVLVDLVDKSKVDKQANIKTCDEYYKQEKKFNAICKQLSKLKTLRVLMILLTVFAVVVPNLVFMNMEGLEFLAIILPIVLVVGFLLIIFLAINPKIKANKSIKLTIEQKMNNLRNVAFSIIEPLLNSFNYLIPKRLIEKTVSNIKMDDYFDINDQLNMTNNFGLMASFDDRESTTNVCSGTFNDCPFVELSSIRQTMRNKVYVGSLTIHWTTTSRDSNGRTRIVHHTQVLHAESIHPAPVYSYQNALCYGNDSAPNLNFFRKPSKIDGMTEGKIERKVKKIGKKLDKKTQDAINDNDPTTNYQVMANTEFEALFGADNRNNEVDFRLLFTPLAQQNEIITIKDKKYFGDDFSFYKDKKLSTIISKHSQNFDFSGNPNNYISFDIRKVEESFLNYNKQYFENLYFDLAPLLNIPAYQQEPESKGKKYKTNRNFSVYEVESIANLLEDNFAPDNAKTRSILKTSIDSSFAWGDRYLVTANAFNSVSRVDFIPRIGGDGRTHLVPVPWEEFFEVYKNTFFEIKRDFGEEDTESWDIRQRGFKAKIIK